MTTMASYSSVSSSSSVSAFGRKPQHQLMRRNQHHGHHHLLPRFLAMKICVSVVVLAAVVTNTLFINASTTTRPTSSTTDKLLRNDIKRQVDTIKMNLENKFKVLSTRVTNSRPSTIILQSLAEASSPSFSSTPNPSAAATDTNTSKKVPVEQPLRDIFTKPGGAIAVTANYTPPTAPLSLSSSPSSAFRNFAAASRTI